MKKEKLEIAAVVVVYNMYCADSPTCRSLLDIDNEAVDVIIYDNSTKDFGNRSYCERRNWTYLGGSGNMGLSKAYNAAIDHLCQQTRTDIICLFDDDTFVETAYFDILKTCYDQSKPKVYVPYIYSAGRLLSPSMITKDGNSTTFQDQESVIDYQGGDLTAINSCMAIDMRIFADYRYDENIFLDGVDHQFIYDCKASDIGIQVIPYTCNHMYSGDVLAPYESALNRFRINIRDYRYIYRKYLPAFIWREGRRALSLTKRYKRTQFITLFLRSLFQRQKTTQ